MTRCDDVAGPRAIGNVSIRAARPTACAKARAGFVHPDRDHVLAVVQIGSFRSCDSSRATAREVPQCSVRVRAGQASARDGPRKPSPSQGPSPDVAQSERIRSHGRAQSGASSRNPLWVRIRSIDSTRSRQASTSRDAVPTTLTRLAMSLRRRWFRRRLRFIYFPVARFDFFAIRRKSSIRRCSVPDGGRVERRKAVMKHVITVLPVEPWSFPNVRASQKLSEPRWTTRGKNADLGAAIQGASRADRRAQATDLALGGSGALAMVAAAACARANTRFAALGVSGPASSRARDDRPSPSEIRIVDASVSIPRGLPIAPSRHTVLAASQRVAVAPAARAKSGAEGHLRVALSPCADETVGAVVQRPSADLVTREPGCARATTTSRERAVSAQVRRDEALRERVFCAARDAGRVACVSSPGADRSSRSGARRRVPAERVGAPHPARRIRHVCGQHNGSLHDDTRALGSPSTWRSGILSRAMPSCCSAGEPRCEAGSGHHPREGPRP